MSHSLADRLLEIVGPGRLLHHGCRDDTLVRALLQRGCDAWGMITDPHLAAENCTDRLVAESARDVLPAFDSVVVSINPAAGADRLPALLRSLRHRTGRNLVLCVSDAGAKGGAADGSDPTDNRQLEQVALAAGYRRHPAGFPVARYERLNDPAPEPLLCFEKIADTVLARWPMEFLLANRDLHMDMTREAGPRSDAHLVRYALAAEWVRPGDTVLDCACGLGYGTAILAAASRGRRFIGVDIDEKAIAYARDNFAGYPIEYRAGSAIRLDFLADHSVDLVVSFETIEHLEDFESFFDEIARVLKPDGRMIGSVPHLWVDETGRDPNPHHFHAFDYAGIRSAFARHFIVEARYGQTAPGGVKLADARRCIDLRPLEPEPNEADTEWWILVAVAHPVPRSTASFQHPEFDPCTAGIPARLTAFAEHYENPWIYRQLIQSGQRIRDPEVLAAAIDAAAAQADRSSADFGAMLAVRAYRCLRQGDSNARIELLAAIEAYLGLRGDNPHVWRWQISLCYVAGLLALDGGQRERGEAFLEQVTCMDPQLFSPLLTTKTIAAHFLLGTIRLVDGNEERARSSFVAGVEAARRALHAPDGNAIGRPDHPLVFGFFELAEIADMAGQCAMAIQRMDQFRHAPGMFWRCVDTRRFGLLTWIRNLEREQELYRAEIDSLRLQATLRYLFPLRLKEVFLVILPSLPRRAWKRCSALLRSVGPAKRGDTR